MKNLITILFVFVAAGCSKPAKTEVSNQEDSVVGAYRNDEMQFIFRNDKVCEIRGLNENGNLTEGVDVCWWEMKNDEVVTTAGGLVITAHGFQMFFFRLGENGDLTLVASGHLKDEKVERNDRATEDFITYKKLK